MKSQLLMLLLVFLFPLFAKSQEIKTVSAVLSTGGIVKSGNEISLSKWRIGVVHQLTLKDQQSELKQITDGRVAAYPNPVVDLLHLRFSYPEKGDYIIEVTDNLGKNLLSTPIRQVINGDVVQMDLSTLKKGLYMVNVFKPDKTSCSNFKIIKN